MNSWEQQENETAKQWEAFQIYRDMGLERSLTAVANQLRKSIQLIFRWAKLNRWNERVREYDAAMDKVRVNTQVDTIKELTQRQVKLGRGWQGVGGAKLKALHQRINVGDPLDDVSIKDAVLATDYGIKMERQALGQETETTAMPKINILIIENRDDNDKADRRIQELLRQQQG